MINPVKIVAGYALAMIAIFVTQVSVYTFLPTSFWFEYEWTRVNGFVEPGGPIPVESKLNRYRETNMKYHDALYCDIGSGFSFYSDYRSSFPNAPRSNGTVVSPWKYQGRVPNNGTCRIRSAISATGPFGSETYPPEISVTPNFEIGKSYE